DGLSFFAAAVKTGVILRKMSMTRIYEGNKHLQSNEIENAFHVQVHHLSKCRIRMVVKRCTPSSSSISNENVHPSSTDNVFDRTSEALNFLELGKVCRNSFNTHFTLDRCSKLF